MPFSFGRKYKRAASAAAHLFELTLGKREPADGASSRWPTRLVDLRSPASFRTGFIPGSYNVPDLTCLLAARQSGLFKGREVYLVADDEEQLHLFQEADDSQGEMQVGGWFDSKILEEWRKAPTVMGELEAINADTLSVRLASWNLLVVAVQASKAADYRKFSMQSDALHFALREMPFALDGLPTETPICLTSANDRISSYAASLLWNFGFHRVCYLSESCSVSMLRRSA